jgi:hypothetical protein
MWSKSLNQPLQEGPRLSDFNYRELLVHSLGFLRVNMMVAVTTIATPVWLKIAYRKEDGVSGHTNSK